MVEYISISKRHQCFKHSLFCLIILVTFDVVKFSLDSVVVVLLSQSCHSFLCFLDYEFPFTFEFGKSFSQDEHCDLCEDVLCDCCILGEQCVELASTCCSQKWLEELLVLSIEDTINIELVKDVIEKRQILVVRTLHRSHCRCHCTIAHAWCLHTHIRHLVSHILILCLTHHHIQKIILLFTLHSKLFVLIIRAAHHTHPIFFRLLLSYLSIHIRFPLSLSMVPL